MPDLLEQGAQWLNDQQREHTSRMVIYQRGELNVEVPATIGRTVHDVENTHGVIEKVETRDFIIRAQDLLLGGSPISPQRGDRVKETVGETTLTYEVMSPGTSTGSSHYRFADPYRLAFRIHTKHIATGAPGTPEAPGEPQ